MTLKFRNKLDSDIKKQRVHKCQLSERTLSYKKHDSTFRMKQIIMIGHTCTNRDAVGLIRLAPTSPAVG